MPVFVIWGRADKAYRWLPVALVSTKILVSWFVSSRFGEFCRRILLKLSVKYNFVYVSFPFSFLYVKFHFSARCPCLTISCLVYVVQRCTESPFLDSCSCFDQPDS